MKRMSVLFLMLFAFAFIYGQKASISISHTVTYDGISVLPDTIIVTNLTQGGDTTLYGADTTLVLDYTTGLSDYKKGEDGLVIMPNYPNPFTTLTYFNVVVPESGNVIIKVYDISGREITSLSGNYSACNHKFSFTTSDEGLYVMQVTLNNKMSAIKAHSIGGVTRREYEISYRGTENANNINKSTDAINSFAYTFGDQLRSVVYYQLMSDSTDFIPAQDTLITINFQNPNLCPTTFTDTRDNQVYTAVQIGTQCWMAENLAYLPAVYPSDSRSNTSSYYYVYDYQGTDVSAAKATSIYQTYGVLYNWPAAMAGQASSNSVPSGVQGICPSGWHLPSDEEWKILEGEVDSQYSYPDPEWDGEGWRGTDAGGNLKETGTTHWNSPNTGATNSSGFTALPAGHRDVNGTFFTLGYVAIFWSSTEDYSNFAWGRYPSSNYANVYRGNHYKELGFSLRCCKDN